MRATASEVGRRHDSEADLREAPRKSPAGGPPPTVIDRWTMSVVTSAFAALIGFFIGGEAATATTTAKYFLLGAALVLSILIGLFGTWAQLRREAST